MNDANQVHFGLLDGLSLRQASFRQTKIRDGVCVVFVDGIWNRRQGIHCSPLAIITSLHHYSTNALVTFLLLVMQLRFFVSWTVWVAMEDHHAIPMCSNTIQYKKDCRPSSECHGCRA
jgi:hypothetical protein